MLIHLPDKFHSHSYFKLIRAIRVMRLASFVFKISVLICVGNIRVIHVL